MPGFCPRGALLGIWGLLWVVFCRGGLCSRCTVGGSFVRGVLSGRILPGGFVRFFCPGVYCPGGFVRGVLSRGVIRRGGCCPVDFVHEGGGCPSGVLSWRVLSRGFCPRGVLSIGGFCPGGIVPWVLSGGFCPEGFVQGVLSGGVLSGGFCPGGFCPRIDEDTARDDALAKNFSDHNFNDFWKVVKNINQCTNIQGCNSYPALLSFNQ